MLSLEVLVGRYIAARAMHGVGLLCVTVVVVFVVFYTLGDPARLLMPLSATDEQVAAYRQAKGFNDPLPVQFARFAGQVVRLDFGNSYWLTKPAGRLVLEYFPRTLYLVVISFTISFFVGTALGTAAALWRGSALDRLLIAFSTFIGALAEFWVGLMLIVLFAVVLRLLPTSGFGLDEHIILPALALSIVPTGRLAVITRSSIVNTISELYVTVATSKGLSKRVVLLRHVLKNAAIPVSAFAGLQLTNILAGGAVVVETIFAWPGIGSLYVGAMQKFDLPLVSAIVFLSTTVVLIINLLLDILYAYIDPRIRYE